MIRDTEQFNKMSELVPTTRRSDLLKGLTQIVDRYGRKPKHAGDKVAHELDQVFVREVAAGVKSLVRLAETVDSLTGHTREEFDACYIEACSKLNLATGAEPSAATGLLNASAMAAAAITAYRLSRSVAPQSKHKPRIAQVAPTMELIGLWERLSGEKIKDPKSARGKDAGGGTNINSDAEFVLQGLRLISPRLSESNGRTLIKNASKALKAQEETASMVATELMNAGTLPTREQMLAIAYREIKKARSEKDLILGWFLSPTFADFAGVALQHIASFMCDMNADRLNTAHRQCRTTLRHF